MPFSFDLKTPFLRINTTVILILSSINFKISVTTRLPIVCYLTVLDRYAFPALIYLDSLCFYHSIIGSSLFAYTNDSVVQLYDKICLITFSTLYMLFHLVYIYFFISKFLKARHLKNSEKIDTLNKNQVFPV